MGSRSFGLIIFSDLSPRCVARLASRIHNEVAEARVCGILHQRRIDESFLRRSVPFLYDSQEGAFANRASPRILRPRFQLLAAAGSVFLRLMHACPPQTDSSTRFELSDLAHFCESIGCSLLVTEGVDSPQALDFVRTLRPDLGLVHGTLLAQPELYAIPRLGSIQVGKHKRPSCSEHAGGMSGESAEPGEEIKVTIHRVDLPGRPGSILRKTSLQIQPYDTLTSLALKSNLLENDMLVCAVADFAQGAVMEEEPGQAAESDDPQQGASHGKQVAPRRAAYRVRRGRPAWKLLLRTLLFGPLVIVRNWIRYVRGSFPVIILYHHVVADRPHHLGIPTDLFFKHVNFLTRYYRVASLTEAIEMLKTGTVKAPTVVLTFDDGYRDNYLNVRAVTEEMGIPASLFVCTGHVTLQKEFGHDLKVGQHNFLPLTWEQVVSLSKKGFEFGSHTRSHFDCGSTDLGALELEIVGSKADLEDRLGNKVNFFSFPWGQSANMSAPAVDLARAIYPYVFSAFGGANFPCPPGQLWHLRRIPHPNDLWELELSLQSVLDF